MTGDPLAEIPRDGYGRPRVTPADGGKPVPYTRCTTYVGALEDTYNLEKWKMRMTAIGLSVRKDLQLAVVAHKDDKTKLNQVVDQAVEAAQASAAANTGTALHALTQQLDEGTLDLATLPAEYRPDIEAYQDVIRKAGARVVAIEQFGVHDGLKVAGTWDRIYEINGRRYIGDLKTGSIEYGIGKIAMQLSVYSRCHTYDPTTHARTPIDVDQDKAIVVHLPAGTGKAFLYWVDVAAAWPAVELAGQVRSWRSRKNLHEPFEYARADQVAPTAETDPILALIDDAPDVASLRELWAANHTKGWTPTHTAAAAARKTHLINTLGETA